MRIVLQRVSQASVSVAGEVVGAIEHGLLLLAGAAQGDTLADVEHMAKKVCELRIFADHEGKMNRSVRDCGGQILLVSQFTLLADTRRGRRPSFIEALAPEAAEPLMAALAAAITAQGVPVATGRFGANMAVALVNDGPVTIVLESSGGVGQKLVGQR